MDDNLEMNELKVVHLPDLCLRKIFRHFGLRDLCKCRAVCRLFKCYADQTEVRELFVNMASVCASENWYLTDRPVDLENKISHKAFSPLNPSQFGPFRQLLSLCIHLERSSKFRFERLNGFRQLQHLQVRLWGISIVREPDELALPNLRVLSIRHLFFSSFVLKAPRLEVLQCDKTENIQIKYPKTIRNLGCHHVNKTTMAKFKRLEVIRCNDVDGLVDVDLSTVWENLKELYIDMEFDDYEREEYEEIRTSLVRLLSQAATSNGGQELKIYLNDVRLLDISQLEDHDFMKDASNFKFSNFKLLQDASFFKTTKVDYNQLARCLRLSRDFLDKFSSIRKVEVTGLVDRLQFEWFLKNASELRHLTLTNTLLDQPLLDNLPNIISRLASFKINGNCPIPLNFDFLLRFPHLRKFRMVRHFDWFLPFVLAKKMFEKIEDFNQFKFRVSWSGVEIKRCLEDKKNFNLVMYEHDDEYPSFEKERLKWFDLNYYFNQREQRHLYGDEYYSDY